MLEIIITLITLLVLMPIITVVAVFVWDGITYYWNEWTVDKWTDESGVTHYNWK